MNSTLRRLTLAITLGMMLGGAALAGSYTGRASITFASTVTRGPDFSGKVASHAFVVTSSPSAAGGELWTMEVNVPVSDMDTDEKKRDRDMREMMSADKFPLVTGKVEGVLESQAKSGKLPFKLTVSGVVRDVTAQISNWKEEGGTISFDAVFPVSLKAHDLKAPRMLFMRVDDIVTVTAHVTLSPKDG